MCISVETLFESKPIVICYGNLSLLVLQTIHVTPFLQRQTKESGCMEDVGGLFEIPFEEYYMFSN